MSCPSGRAHSSTMPLDSLEQSGASIVHRNLPHNRANPVHQRNPNFHWSFVRTAILNHFEWVIQTLGSEWNRSAARATAETGHRMQLICSQCEVIYETNDAVFPKHGRQVRCTNCGHTWHQMPKKLESTETTDQQTKSERSTEVANPQLTQTGPSPEVLKVLREEADRETRARKEEARATSDNSGSDGQRVELDPGTLTPALQKGEASTSQHGGSVRATALPKTKRRGDC